MAKVNVRYYVVLPGRDAGVRRFWRPGPKLRRAGWRQIRLADGEAGAIAEAQAINGAVDAWAKGGQAEPSPDYLAKVLEVAPAGVVKGDDRAADGKQLKQALRPGTLAALIYAYRQHEDFLDLERTTRKSYEDNLRALDSWAGDAPLQVLGPTRFKVLWRSLRKATPTKAKGVIGMARILFGWARREAGYKGYIEDGVLVHDNPAAKLNIKSAKPVRTEDDLWSDVEISMFSAVADMMGWHSIGTAVELNAWMGQREGDVLTVGANRYKDGILDVGTAERLGQSKTGARVRLPLDMVPELKARLDEQRRRQRVAADTNVAATTLLVSESTGRAWNEHTFRQNFRAVREEATKWCPSLAKKQFMLLRHTAVARLAESGCTAEEIASITGHTLETVNAILERYLVRTTKLAATAFRKRLLALSSGQ